MGLSGSNHSRSFAPNILRTALALAAAGLFVVGLAMPASQPAVAAAGINKTINLQGRLLTNTGAVVADGNYNMRFIIYQGGTGTSATNGGVGKMWTEEDRNFLSEGITVKNGYYSVTLGAYCAFDGSACSGGQSQTNTTMDWNQDTLWLSMDLGGTASVASPTYDGELLPMRRMSSAVYALQAQSATTCTGCLLQAPTSTAQNTIAPTGASTVGLTVKQTSTASPTGHILDVFGADGFTSFIQVTGPAANVGAVTVQSQGSNPLTLQSGNGIVTLGTSTTLTANGALTVQSTGSNPLTLAANGSNQNVNVNPTGSGSVLIGGTTPTVGTPTAASPLALVIQTGTASGGAGSILTLQAGTASSGVGGTATLLGGSTVSGGVDGQVTVDAGSGATTPNGTVSIGGSNASVINVGSVGSTIKATDVHINDSNDTTKTLTTKIGSAAANTADISIIQGGSNTTQAIQLTPNTAGGILIGAAAGTGAITVGSSSTTQSVLIGNGAGVPTVSIANASIVGATVNIAGATNTSGTTAVNIANGLSAATSNVNILSGAGTAGGATLLMADNPRVTQIDLGNVANAANRTTNIAVGATLTTFSDTVNIATGNTAGTGTKVVHIADGTPVGSNTVFIGSLATTSATTIQAGTGNINLNTNQAGAGTLVKTITTNSTTAFQIQNSAATSFFTADSTKDIITTNDVNIGSAINISAPGRLFSDGFETGDGTTGGNDSLWIGGIGGTGTITSNEAATVRNGKYSAKIATSTQTGYIQTAILANTTVYARTYFDNTATTNPTELLDLGTAAIASGTHLYIYLGASGFLCYNYGGNGTAAGGTTACSTSTITAFTSGPWHKLEAKYVAGTGANGVLQVFLDNNLVVSNSNAINISNGAWTLALTNIAIGGGLSQGVNTTYYDDVAVDTVATGDSSSLNVNDSLRVSGSTSIGTSLLVGTGTTSSSATLTVKSESNNAVTSAFASAGTGQSFVVPANVNSVIVSAWGAGGGGGAGNTGTSWGGNGGGGGFVRATVATTPGETLLVDVGTGGNKGATNTFGGYGGGFSALRRSGTYLAQVGGGGGGGGADGSTANGAGGDGGPGSGGNGANGGFAAGIGPGGTRGTGATTSTGGTGGAGGGTAGAGGNGVANAGGDGGGYTGTCSAAGSNNHGSGQGGGKGGSTAACDGGGGGGGGAFGGGGSGSTTTTGSATGGGGGGSGLVTGTNTTQDIGLSKFAPDLTDTTYSSCSANAGWGGSGFSSNVSNTAGNRGCVVITYVTTAARTNALNVQTSDGTDMFKISSSGAAYFRDSVDSTLAAQFLDTSGAPVLSIDTLNGNVTIGSGGTGEAVPNLLVLDNGTTASTDPAAPNGAMYYNAPADKFRCNEAGVWTDCLSGVQNYNLTNVSVNGNTTSNSYGNFPGPSSVTFTKKEASSKVLVSVSVSYWELSVSTATFIGVNIAGTDHDCARFFFNNLTEHSTLSCSLLLTGLATGSQTAQVRWKTSGSGSTLTADVNDYVTVSVQETE